MAHAITHTQWRAHSTDSVTGWIVAAVIALALIIGGIALMRNSDFLFASSVVQSGATKAGVTNTMSAMNSTDSTIEGSRAESLYAEVR